MSSALGFLWKEWCWSWNSNTLATSCEELTHWKRLWCWEGFGAGGEGDDRGWDGWMASLSRWTWVWVNSGRWWWTERPGMLRFMGSQRVGHDWATELNWTEESSSWFIEVQPFSSLILTWWKESMNKLSSVSSYKNTKLIKLGCQPYGLMNHNYLHNGCNSKYNYKAYWGVNV